MMLEDQLVSPFVPENLLVERGVPILLALAVLAIARFMKNRSRAKAAPAKAPAETHQTRH